MSGAAILKYKLMSCLSVGNPARIFPRPFHNRDFASVLFLITRAPALRSRP